MTHSPGKLLVALVGEAADAALASPTLRGRTIDRGEFIGQNRAALLSLIARQSSLRTRLAAQYAEQLRSDGCRHPLLDDLLDADAGTSAAAAKRLGTDPTALVAISVAIPTASAKTASQPTSAPAGATLVDERRFSRLQRDLKHVRERRDQARGQLQYTRSELLTARQQLQAALSDRDEALTAAEALRAQLAGERSRIAHLDSDVVHAAEVLARALRPAPAPAIERDPRELDRQDNSAIDSADVVLTPALAPPDSLVTDALARADLVMDAFLAALDAIAAPPAEEPASPLFTRSREICVTPLGGGTDIGGSCILVEAGDARILVDCGTRPKQRLSCLGPPDLDVALAGNIDAVVITHAHNDHAGFIPALVARYPFMDVLCTADTAALLPTMWNDSVKVFERTGHERVEPGEPADEPPYRSLQVFAAQDRIRPVAFGRVVEVADGVTIELFPAGHILGAAGVVVTAGTARVTITGDVSHPAQGQASVSGLILPAAAHGSDLLVIESTYCKADSNRAREVERFTDTVSDTVNNGGRVLVPAFALGRAQEVLLTLRNELPGVPVLVDGLAKTISHLYEQQTANCENPLKIFGEDVREVTPGTRREQYIALRRGVIVTTSGMLTGGPAITWARWLLPDPKAALLVSGYQDEESAGHDLLQLAKQQSPTFMLEGEPIEVQARVASFALSAHADRSGLTSIIADVAPKHMMLVHGLASAQREFAQHLRRRGHSVAATDRWQR
ncbi:MAG TPA: MBL fold metallo-hydrolase [Amycolatopsis sp.]|uniref:MBL fold metallo-hydrolase n=1 Tax=Amycolatopsis sp. TaxID=37632 RepID=UPI002B49FC2A|nr:MBL fold metallo-hydrolase [Amycolatopsis sp.]HKS47772.1 MBL fold metallo-hydrolase [Amycolatopsis sp.]